VAVRAKPRFITIALIKHLLEEIVDPRDDSVRGRTESKKARLQRKRVDFVVDTLCTLAMNGDTTAIKMIMDRVEGLAIQTVQFRPQDLEDSAQTPEEAARITAVHAKIKDLPQDDLRALYHATIASATITEGSRTQGSA